MLQRIRDVVRERFDVELAQDVLEHPTLLDSRRVVAADQLQHDGRLDRLIQTHAEQVDMDRVAADRMAGELLEHDRCRAGSVDAQVEHGPGVGECLPQHAGVDLERDRVIPTAVDDPRHVAFPAQAPSGPRASGLALHDFQGCCIGACHRRSMVASAALLGLAENQSARTSCARDVQSALVFRLCQARLS